MRFFKGYPALLYSYLASEILAPFFASFIIMNCVFFLVKLIPFLNFVLELQINFVDFIRIFSYLFPNMFLYSIPMSAMIGVTIAFSRLSNDTEILAMKASGVSVFQILPPVVLITFIIASITAYFSFTLIPVSERALEQFTYQLLKEKIDKGIKERQFTEALGDIVVYVGDVDKKSGEWSEVWVSDIRGQENPTITMAKKGRMETDLDALQITITLEEGSLHRPDNANAQIVTFDKYKLHIPLKTPHSSTNKVNRGTLSLQQLLERADQFGRDSVPGRRYVTEYHKRIVLPVGCFILSLIGLPLGLQARPGRKAIGIPLGLGIFIAYYVGFTFAKLLSKEPDINIGLVMWMPNIFFSLVAVFLTYRVAYELPLLPERLTVIYGRITTKIFSFINPLFTRKKPDNEQLSGSTSLQFPALKNRLFKKRPTIHANAKSRVFHLPECEFYECKNCSIEFKNVEIALASNFTPCKFCKSLIDNDAYDKDVFL